MKRLLCLVLAALLALSLTACDPKEDFKQFVSDTIINMATWMGIIDGEADDDDDVDTTRAPAGGSIALPEGWDPTGSRIVTTVQDGVLYAGFNGIRDRSTPYFVATSDSTTLTCYAASTNESAETPPRFKAALWRLSEDQTHTSYVPDSTVYFSAAGAGACYTQTVRGLVPGERYKITISYDTNTYYISGVVTATNISDQPLTDPAAEGEA